MTRRVSIVVLALASFGCFVGSDDVESPEPSEPLERKEVDPQPRSESLAARIEPHTEAARAAAKRREYPPVVIDESLSPEARGDRAREGFEQARAAFERAEYEAAALGFEEAYAYSPTSHPLLFNAGVAWQRAGDCCRAELRFREFIAAAPDDLAVSEVKRRLEDTTCTCAPSSGPLE